jgi:uncharacterized membrane protein (DUF2068 family)
MAIDRGIRLIAYFKFFKGALLVASGIGLIKLLHKDVAEVVNHWISTLHFDPDNRHIHDVLLRASVVNQRQLKALGVGSFVYAGIFLTEGSALLMQKRWATYFTAIITASFIPFELWELVEHFSTIRTVVIMVNVIILWYLAAKIKFDRTRSNAQ